MVELRLLSRLCVFFWGFFDLSEDRLDFLSTLLRGTILPQHNQPFQSFGHVLGSSHLVVKSTKSHLHRMWLFWVLPVEVTSETSVFPMLLDTILKILDPTESKKNRCTFLRYLGRSHFLSFKAEKFPASFGKSLPMSSFSLVPLRDLLTSASSAIKNLYVKLDAAPCPSLPKQLPTLFLSGWCWSPTSLFICSSFSRKMVMHCSFH